MKYILAHCGDRGVRGQKLFLTPKHFDYFLGILVKYSRELAVKVIAYCLMTNHYHLLLLIPAEVRTTFFRKLNTAYAMFFNKSVDHPGHVFDPRSWCFERSSPSELAAVARYIPLNPVKPKMAKLPHEYLYSSYAATIGERPKPEWIEDELLLQLFDSDLTKARVQYRFFVESGIDIRLSAYALAERVSGLCCDGVRAPKMRDQIELLTFTAESIVRAFNGKLPFDLTSPDLMLYCMDKFGWVPQTVLANMYEIPRSTMGDRLRRLRSKMVELPEIEQQLSRALLPGSAGKVPPLLPDPAGKVGPFLPAL